jgi:predicted metal-binding transcription factor (methanogenesis marker protein 9)
LDTNIPKVTNDLDCLKSLAFLVCAVSSCAFSKALKTVRLANTDFWQTKQPNGFSDSF